MLFLLCFEEESYYHLLFLCQQSASGFFIESVWDSIRSLLSLNFNYSIQHGLESSYPVILYT